MFICKLCGKVFENTNNNLGEEDQNHICSDCEIDKINEDETEPDLNHNNYKEDEIWINNAILTSTPNEIKNAKKMIDLADEYPDLAKTLYASAVIILISVLECATRSFFYGLALDTANKEQIDYRMTQAYRQSELSLRQRLRLLPEVASGGKYTINRNSKDIQIIQDMITKRNELIHRKDLVNTANVAELREGLIDGVSARIENHKLWIEFDIDNIISFSASKSEAFGIYSAVDKYCDDVAYFFISEDSTESDSELLYEL